MVNLIQFLVKSQEKEGLSELDLFLGQEVLELLDNQQLKKFYSLQEFKIAIPAQEDLAKQKEIVLKQFIVHYKELINF